MVKILKWALAVALGTLIGAVGVVWIVSGWSGVIVALVVLFGGKGPW